MRHRGFLADLPRDSSLIHLQCPHRPEIRAACWRHACRTSTTDRVATSRPRQRISTLYSLLSTLSTLSTVAASLFAICWKFQGVESPHPPV